MLQRAGETRSISSALMDAIHVPVPPKRYRVGELVDYTGLSRQTLHNYVQWGLIQDVGRTAGGHRLYDESVFVRLSKIRALKSSNTIEQIRMLLNKD